ncbi:hypothetical protein E2320_017899 [Naja naja]|nr:hypothetical protein E2320_017899 [Naja naja]
MDTSPAKEAQNPPLLPSCWSPFSERAGLPKEQALALRLSHGPVDGSRGPAERQGKKRAGEGRLWAQQVLGGRHWAHSGEQASPCIQRLRNKLLGQKKRSWVFLRGQMPVASSVLWLSGKLPSWKPAGFGECVCGYASESPVANSFLGTEGRSSLCGTYKQRIFSATRSAVARLPFCGAIGPSGFGGKRDPEPLAPFSPVDKEECLPLQMLYPVLIMQGRNSSQREAPSGGCARDSGSLRWRKACRKAQDIHNCEDTEQD